GFQSIPPQSLILSVSTLHQTRTHPSRRNNSPPSSPSTEAPAPVALASSSAPLPVALVSSPAATRWRHTRICNFKYVEWGHMWGS
ncbi:unnamed protein product, partial [Linum tenue]